MRFPVQRFANEIAQKMHLNCLQMQKAFEGSYTENRINFILFLDCLVNKKFDHKKKLAGGYVASSYA